MAAVYERGREAFLKGQIPYLTGNIKICLVSSNYVGGNTALYGHQYYSDLGSNVIPCAETCITLTNKTTNIANALGVMGGVAGASNITFHSVNGGYTVGYFVLFMDTASTSNGAPASPTTAPLILMVDAGYGIGLNTNGGDFNIAFDSVNQIFKL